MEWFARLRRAASNTRSMWDITSEYRTRTAAALVGGSWAIRVADTPVGSFLVHPQDIGVSRPLYIGQAYEAGETKVFQRVLRTGQCVIDIGANIGYTVRLATDLVGPGGRVLAIEPDPDNLRLLRANTRHLPQVAICACAVGAEPGVASLSRSRWNAGDHRLYGNDGREQVTVPVNTVDRLVAEHKLSPVHFIKMDVQGYEPHVLPGMLATLRRDHPLLLTEFWPNGMRAAGGNPEVFLGSLHSLGYTAETPEGQPIDSLAEIERRLDPSFPESHLNLIFS